MTIQSQKITSTQNITVDSSIQSNYLIEVIIDKDTDATLKINSTSNEAIILKNSVGWKRFFKERVTDTLIFTVTSGTILLNIITNNIAHLKIE